MGPLPKWTFVVVPTILLATIVLIPLAQLGGARSASGWWTALTFGLLAVGLFQIAVWPWLRSRPLRLRARSVSAEHPGDVVVPVMFEGRPATLRADGSGFRIESISGDLLRSTKWGQVVSFGAAPPERWRFRSVEIDALDGRFAFQPLRPGASSPMTEDEIARLLADFDLSRRARDTR